MGCELCAYEEIVLKHKGDSIPKLQKCPQCGEISLLLHQCSNRFECLNFDCTLGDAEYDS